MKEIINNKLKKISKKVLTNTEAGGIISLSTRYINQTKGGLVHWEQQVTCFQYKGGRVSIPVESTGTVKATDAREKFEEEMFPAI